MSSFLWIFLRLDIFSPQSVFENCFLPDVRHNLWEICPAIYPSANSSLIKSSCSSSLSALSYIPTGGGPRFPLQIKQKKSTDPTALSLQNQYFLVRLRGLEPRTNRLRVYCSTNWAKGAYTYIIYVKRK